MCSFATVASRATLERQVATDPARKGKPQAATTDVNRK
jgi:hypothetical protein